MCLSASAPKAVDWVSRPIHGLFRRLDAAPASAFHSAGYACLFPAPLPRPGSAASTTSLRGVTDNDCGKACGLRWCTNMRSLPRGSFEEVLLKSPCCIGSHAWWQGCHLRKLPWPRPGPRRFRWRPYQDSAAQQNVCEADRCYLPWLPCERSPQLLAFRPRQSRCKLHELPQHSRSGDCGHSRSTCIGRREDPKEVAPRGASAQRSKAGRKRQRSAAMEFSFAGDARAKPKPTQGPTTAAMLQLPQ